MEKLSVYLSCPVCEHIFKFTPPKTEAHQFIGCVKCGYTLTINYGIYLHVTLRGNSVMQVDEFQMEEA